MQALLRNGGARALANAGRGAFAPAGTSASSLIAPTAGTLGSPRWIGDTGVPENYGQWKDGGPGTGFLGTPKNHREVRAARDSSLSLSLSLSPSLSLFASTATAPRAPSRAIAPSSDQK